MGEGGEGLANLGDNINGSKVDFSSFFTRNSRNFDVYFEKVRERVAEEREKKREERKRNLE